MSIPTEPRHDTRPASTNGDLATRVQQLRLDGQLGTGRVSSRGAWLPWVLCVLMALTWVGVGVRWYRTAADRRDETPAATPGPAATPSGGGSAIPAAAPGEIVLQLKGTVIPSLQIAVSPRDVAGEITGITFAEGKRVRKGETLATLLDPQYRNRFETDQASLVSTQARVIKGQAAVAAAEARVVRARAILLRAANDLEKARTQIERSAISRQDYDKAVAEHDAAKADLDAAEKDVEAARAEVRAAEADVHGARSRRDESKRLLDNCVIVAPIDGTVLSKKADVGSLVSPAAFNVAASLCEIADLKNLEVEMEVPERQITRLLDPKTGATRNLECRIAADADPNRFYRGWVDRVMPIADDSKNVVKVRVRVMLPPDEEPGSFLRPKMSAVVVVYNRDFGGEKK